MRALRMRGIALVTVLIFMLLVTIISGAALSIMTKQARLAENQIRRVRGFYAAEAAINKAYQSLRFLTIPPALPACPAANQWCINNIPGPNDEWEWNWTGEFVWDPSIGTTRDILVRYNPNAANIVVAGITLTPRELRAIVDYGL